MRIDPLHAFLALTALVLLAAWVGYNLYPLLH